MNDVTLTLFGTALIVAVPSLVSAFLGRSRSRKIDATAVTMDATHEAVQVLNGTPDQPEPLGEYIHRRFHMLDGQQGAIVGCMQELLRSDDTQTKILTEILRELQRIAS